MRHAPLDQWRRSTCSLTARRAATRVSADGCCDAVRRDAARHVAFARTHRVDGCFGEKHGSILATINRRTIGRRGLAWKHNPSWSARRRVRSRRRAPLGGVDARAMIRPIRGVSLVEAEVRLAVVRAGHIVRGKWRASRASAPRDSSRVHRFAAATAAAAAATAVEAAATLRGTPLRHVSPPFSSLRRVCVRARARQRERETDRRVRALFREWNVKFVESSSWISTRAATAAAVAARLT